MGKKDTKTVTRTMKLKINVLESETYTKDESWKRIRELDKNTYSAANHMTTTRFGLDYMFKNLSKFNSAKETTGEDRFVTQSVIIETKKDTKEIIELPIRLWTNKFKDYC